MKKKMLMKITAKSYSNPADELKEALASLPQGATYDLHYSAGDRPWESGYFTITFEWEA